MNALFKADIKSRVGLLTSRFRHAPDLLQAEVAGR